jgi:hypothetical protein
MDRATVYPIDRQRRGWAPRQDWGCCNLGVWVSPWSRFGGCWNRRDRCERFTSAHAVGGCVFSGVGCRPQEKEWVDAKLLRRSATPIPSRDYPTPGTWPPGCKTATRAAASLARDRRRCSGVRSPEFSYGRAEDGRERCGGGNDGLPGPRWAGCLHKGVRHRGISPAGLVPGTLVGVRPTGFDR